MPAAASGKRRAALAFVMVSIVLDMMAGSLIGPVLPRLVRGVSGFGMVGVAQIFGAMLTVFFVIQFFAGPIQGALSDRFGRRPVILASTFGLAADYLIMALAPNIAWLFVGRVITGAMAGGFFAAYAYVADVTEPEQLARRFGLVSAAMSAGLAIGPILGGVLGDINVRAPFWVAGALGLASGLYGLFVLPESLPASQRDPLKLNNLHPLGALVSMWREFPVLRLWGLAFIPTNLGFTEELNSIFSDLHHPIMQLGAKRDRPLHQRDRDRERRPGAIIRGGTGRAVAGRASHPGHRLHAPGPGDAGRGSCIHRPAVLVGHRRHDAGRSRRSSADGDPERAGGACRPGPALEATRSLASIASVGAPAGFSLLFAATGGDPKSLIAGAPFYVATALLALGVVTVVSALTEARTG